MLKEAAMAATAAGVGAMAVASAGHNALGFTSAGVSLGSASAGIQSAVYGAAGQRSVFAICQSIAAGGTSLTPLGLGAALVAGGVMLL